MEFGTPGMPSRREKSLGVLTMKFVGLLQQAEDGVLDLKEVSGAAAGGIWELACCLTAFSTASLQKDAGNKRLSVSQAPSQVHWFAVQVD